MTDPDNSATRGQFRHHHQSEQWETRIFEALNLITIGIILLLNTTGVISWGVWLNVLKLWPLFIVSAGIGIIFSEPRVLKFIGSLLNYILFLAIFAFAIYSPLALNWMFFPVINNGQTQSAEYQIKETEFSEVKTKSLTSKVSIGELNLSDSSSKDYLTSTSKYYADSQKPVITKAFADNNLAINFDLENEKNSNFWLGNNGPQYNLELGQPEIATNISLSFGAGSGKLNFTKQLIKDFGIEVGAGSVANTFTADSLPSGDFRIKVGLGSIDLTIPADVGVKLIYKVGLGSITYADKKISSGTGDSTFTSDNYNTATKTAVINLEVGLGSIDINVD